MDRFFVARSLFLTLLLVATPSWAKGTVLFMTDFGLQDDSIAICKGVMLGINPDLRIIDISHDVRKFSVRDGARFLAGTAPFYGPGTVFVAVIDPGVGSARKPVVGKTKRGQFFVVPDNGLLSYLEEREGIEEVREIKNPNWVRSLDSATFGGRDIFSPVAAHLAAGESFGDVGPVVTNWVHLSVPRATRSCERLTGSVLSVEYPYGNLVTNISGALFSELEHQPGAVIEFRFNNRPIKMPILKTFSDVPRGKPLAYTDSRGHLGFAINQGDFAKTYGVRPDDQISVPSTAQSRAHCRK